MRKKRKNENREKTCRKKGKRKKYNEKKVAHAFHATPQPRRRESRGAERSFSSKPAHAPPNLE